MHFLRLLCFVLALFHPLATCQDNVSQTSIAKSGQIVIPFVGFRQTANEGVLFFVALQNRERYVSFDLKGYLLTDRPLQDTVASANYGYYFKNRKGKWCKTSLGRVQGSTQDLKRRVAEQRTPDYVRVVEERRHPNGCDFAEEQILVSKFAQDGGIVYLYSPEYEDGRRRLVASYRWTSLELPRETGQVTFSVSR